MTLKERMEILERKARKEWEIKVEKFEKIEAETSQKKKEVESLAPRIHDLITLVNKCIEEGIELPKPEITAKFGYGEGYRSYNFYSDGIHHHVGFMQNWVSNGGRGKIEYLGIVEGGFRGVWDFYTNGESTFLKHENSKAVKPVELEYLNDFLKEFDQFEEAFYKWIDSLAD